MAYPASQTAAADAFAQINRTAISVKAQATDLSTRSAAGPIPRHEVLELQRVCASAASRLQQLSTTPGLVAYAREQLDQPALDVAGEFAAMRSALIGLGDCGSPEMEAPLGTSAPQSRPFGPLPSAGEPGRR